MHKAELQNSKFTIPEPPREQIIRLRERQQIEDTYAQCFVNANDMPILKIPQLG